MALLNIPKAGVRLEPRHLCAGARCLTMIPLWRDLCQFCVKPAAGPVKTCLRCGFLQPLAAFAWGGTCRLCDTCRWQAKMTEAEARESKRLWAAENRRRYLRRAA